MTDPQRELIVAIDGPSGVGKSTLSRALADYFDYLNIDTGAMYRSVALAARRAGIEPCDQADIISFSRSLKIAFSKDGDGVLRTFLNDEDVSQEIRTPEVSSLTPLVAAVAGVREALVEQQRLLGAGGGVVLEGRDIGSVVFPQAEVKIYLQATSEERGLRRFRELRAKGMEVDLIQTIRDVNERDEADMGRSVAPLIQPDDATAVDTTGLSIDEVLARLISLVEDRRRESGLSPVVRPENA